MKQKERCEKTNEGCEQRVKKGELRVDAQKKRKAHTKGVIEGKKKEKQVSFYAKASDVKRAYFSQLPMIVLLYKEAYLATNKLNISLSSVFKSLLQKYKVVFPEEVPKGLPPSRGIEHQIDFSLGS